MWLLISAFLSIRYRYLRQQQPKQKWPVHKLHCISFIPLKDALTPFCFMPTNWTIPPECSAIDKISANWKNGIIIVIDTLNQLPYVDQQQPEQKQPNFRYPVSKVHSKAVRLAVQCLVTGSHQYLRFPAGVDSTLFIAAPGFAVGSNFFGIVAERATSLDLILITGVDRQS